MTPSTKEKTKGEIFWDNFDLEKFFEDCDKIGESLREEERLEKTFGN